MTDEPSDRPVLGGDDTPHPLTFMVLVDDSDEMRKALRFACIRARATGGRVVLMRIVEPPDFQHFKFVGDKMKSEALGDAEKRLQRLAAEVQRLSGRMPMLTVREGKPSEEITDCVREDPTISVLVLAAAGGKEGPGPLISGLAGSFGAGLRVPVLVIPAHMSEEDIDRLA
ncbi:universal stress protein [Roseospira navarrensis]|uniref:Universal stress protein n=1 Tax=Roseospira navarrensis TaxID=140058 RepID=A0A7X1ZCL6_9PROT|nr:universal stress protein [Roseospira navarrensis]MQX36080.1 universal stress protein [Roseospira navarrensis]